MSVLNTLGMPLLRMLGAEQAHDLAIRALETGLVRVRQPREDDALATQMFGLNFPNPVGLAAGFDKDAQVPDAILGLGFGFTEVGTVTPLPQSGNPQPRMFRLSADKGVINRLGFNNKGHAAALERLAGRERQGIVGVNIGANKDSADKIADYVLGVKMFRELASYLTINVSSPNTPGLRGLQDRTALEELLGRVSEVWESTPVLLKVAPDLDDDAISDIAEVVMQNSVDCIIVSNTTISRLPLKSSERNEQGGLSGAPLFELSTQILAKFSLATDGKVPLVGAGGIMSGGHAWEKLRAGASLVQIYSGMVYEGPGLATKINRYLSQRVRREGLTHIRDVTGTGAKEWSEL